jgi:hypothetical protein
LIELTDTYSFKNFRHDEVSSLMNIPGRSFSENYADEVEGLQRCLLTFVKSKKAAFGARTNNNAGTGTDTPNVENNLDVKMNDEGFPILPSAIKSRGLSKKQYETIMHNFLSQHYCEFWSTVMRVINIRVRSDLATGHRQKQVPYQALALDPTPFIANEYRTLGITLNDPRNMHKADIESFLSDVYKRQEEHGPAWSFRFSSCLDSDKKRMEAIYVDTEDVEEPVRTKSTKKGKGKERVIGENDHEKPVRKKRTKKGKGKGKERDIEQLDDLLPLVDDEWIGPQNSTEDGPIMSGSASILPVPEFGSVNQEARAYAGTANIPNAKGTLSAPDNAETATSQNAGRTLSTAGAANTGGSAPDQTQCGAKGKQRKVVNSDALAMREAEQLMRTEKRNPRPRVRDS